MGAPAIVGAVMLVIAGAKWKFGGQCTRPGQTDESQDDPPGGEAEPGGNEGNEIAGGGQTRSVEAPGPRSPSANGEPRAPHEADAAAAPASKSPANLIGLDSGSVVCFVSPDGQLACVRAGERQAGGEAQLVPMQPLETESSGATRVQHFPTSSAFVVMRQAPGGPFLFCSLGQQGHLLQAPRAAGAPVCVCGHRASKHHLWTLSGDGLLRNTATSEVLQFEVRQLHIVATGDLRANERAAQRRERVLNIQVAQLEQELKTATADLREQVVTGRHRQSAAERATRDAQAELASTRAALQAAEAEARRKAAVMQQLEIRLAQLSMAADGAAAAPACELVQHWRGELALADAKAAQELQEVKGELERLAAAHDREVRTLQAKHAKEVARLNDIIDGLGGPPGESRQELLARAEQLQAAVDESRAANQNLERRAARQAGQIEEQKGLIKELMDELERLAQLESTMLSIQASIDEATTPRVDMEKCFSGTTSVPEISDTPKPQCSESPTSVPHSHAHLASPADHEPSPSGPQRGGPCSPLGPPADLAAGTFAHKDKDGDGSGTVATGAPHSEGEQAAVGGVCAAADGSGGERVLRTLVERAPSSLSSGGAGALTGSSSGRTVVLALDEGADGGGGGGERAPSGAWTEADMVLKDLAGLSPGAGPADGAGGSWDEVRRAGSLPSVDENRAVGGPPGGQERRFEGGMEGEGRQESSHRTGLATGRGGPSGAADPAPLSGVSAERATLRPQMLDLSFVGAAAAQNVRQVALQVHVQQQQSLDRLGSGEPTLPGPPMLASGRGRPRVERERAVPEVELSRVLGLPRQLQPVARSREHSPSSASAGSASGPGTTPAAQASLQRRASVKSSGSQAGSVRRSVASLGLKESGGLDRASGAPRSDSSREAESVAILSDVSQQRPGGAHSRKGSWAESGASAGRPGASGWSGCGGEKSGNALDGPWVSNHGGSCSAGDGVGATDVTYVEVNGQVEKRCTVKQTPPQAPPSSGTLQAHADSRDRRAQRSAARRLSFGLGGAGGPHLTPPGGKLRQRSKSASRRRTAGAAGEGAGGKAGAPGAPGMSSPRVAAHMGAWGNAAGSRGVTIPAVSAARQEGASTSQAGPRATGALHTAGTSHGAPPPLDSAATRPPLDISPLPAPDDGGPSPAPAPRRLGFLDRTAVPSMDIRPW